MMLVYLLPDTRTSAMTIRISHLFHAPILINAIHRNTQMFQLRLKKQSKYSQLCSTKHPKDGFLACEKTLMSKVKLVDIPIVLFATYYVFNMEYSIGCSNYFSFLEVIFLNCATKRNKINHLLNMLDNTNV